MTTLRVTSEAWAVSLPIKHAAAAAPLRKHSDVEVCVVGERLWLRGARWSEELDQSFRKILGAERFRRLPDGRIAPHDCILPSCVIPQADWSPLRAWLQPVAPPTILPSNALQRAPLRLVRTTMERPANLLVIGFPAWHEYAVSAPQVRLNKLAFAVSDDGQALIRGEPLPPLPGMPYVETHGVATPAGWTWSPAVDADVVRQAIGLADGAIALFTPDDVHPYPDALQEEQGVSSVYDVIESDDFVRATRSAVRLSAKELGHVA